MKNRTFYSSFILSTFFLPATFFPTISFAATSTQQEFVQLSKKIIPSVVNISTSSKNSFSPFSKNPQEDLFRRFFEDFLRENRPQDSETTPMALGTGFIIDSSGLILTNHHVIAGADEVKITFTEDENEIPTSARIVGKDPELDLALIKVNTSKKLTPAVLGNSDTLEVGEYVMAVGNPFGQGHSVTHGIISAKGRKSPDFQLASYIQTDAPINPGNSGGPLVNLSGEVIGINNAIDQRAQGIGFAIPINLVKEVLPQLKEKGSVDRGFIGVQVNDMTPALASRLGVKKDLKACFVVHVYPQSPAARAGVQAYDIITHVNEKVISSSSALIKEITSIPIHKTIELTLLRNKKTITLPVKIGLRPTQTETESPKKQADDNTTQSKSGLELKDITPAVAKEWGLPGKLSGVLVTALKYGSPADQAGFMRGDVIVEVDRKPVKTTKQFESLTQKKQGYLVRVRRINATGGEDFQVLVLNIQ